MSKRLVELFAKVAGQKAGEPCKECGAPNPKYWYGVCPCGWHGTADKASGGGSIADTGDFDDVHCPACDREDELEDGPCPTCACLREISKMCWHEGKIKIKVYPQYNESLWECKCGATTASDSLDDKPDNEQWNNPTFTVQSVRALLEDIGEKAKFIKWHNEQCLVNVQIKFPDFKFIFDIQHEYNYDILTSDPLMTEAAIAYLEEK